ncbi:MAG: PDZ domain-containing protein [Saprospiraceae bacterium]|nr:PDZ domain-containing protein [Saprospiraceae bacterium]
MFIGQKLPHYDQDFRLSGGKRLSSGALEEILQYVEAKYVDSVNTIDLRSEAIEHLLSRLDPHSVYITPDELQAVQEDMSGGFEGVGIEFVMVDDTMHVVTPLSGGPAEAAGIIAGDRIITINDTSIAGVKIDNGSIYKKLRGEKGSQVKIGILRGLEKQLRHFIISRAIIPVHSVDVAYMLDQETGYIKVNRFTERTYQEFMESLGPMVEEKGLKNLVLDLRGNPGGYLEEATDMLSQIFPEGKLLVYTKGRTEKRRDYKSNGRARFNIQQVAVLIDEGSASASEIVAGAVQDWDRGWVVGRRSFGKGLVQEQYPLSNGGALRLTVSRYFTPSGRSIQRDYKNDEHYDQDPERRLKNGELSDDSKIKPADSTKYYTGLGRIVFGGGGVTPDVFVPFDTILSSEYFLLVRQLIPQFVSKWKEGSGSQPSFSNLPEFVEKWQVPDALFNELIKFAESRDVKTDAGKLAACRHELKLQLKARIAKSLFGDLGLYQVANSDDPTVEKAWQLIRSGQPISKK